MNAERDAKTPPVRDPAESDAAVLPLFLTRGRRNRADGLPHSATRLGGDSWGISAPVPFPEERLIRG
jgi:hypothetical protein